jgi:hypothetical protein
MSDHDTPSSIFTLCCRKHTDSQYEDRDVNMAFENRHMPLFKIVPPTAGSFIYLEAKYRIDHIEYKNSKIILYMTRN